MVTVLGAEEDAVGKLCGSHQLDLKRSVHIQPSVSVHPVVSIVSCTSPTPGFAIVTADVSVHLAVDNRARELPAFRYALVENELKGPVFALQLRNIGEDVEEIRMVTSRQIDGHLSIFIHSIDARNHCGVR